MARRRTPANGENSSAQPKRRGRPRGSTNKPKLEIDGGQDAAPDIYNTEMYSAWLERIDQATSELHTAQAEVRVQRKAETGRGLDRKADDFVRSLRSQVNNGDLSLREAQERIDNINIYWDWTGLPLDLAAEQRGRVEEATVEPAI